MVTFKNNQIVADIKDLELFNNSVNECLSTLHYEIFEIQEYISISGTQAKNFYVDRINSLQLMYDYLSDISYACYAAREVF